MACESNTSASCFLIASRIPKEGALGCVGPVPFTSPPLHSTPLVNGESAMITIDIEVSASESLSSPVAERFWSGLMLSSGSERYSGVRMPDSGTTPIGLSATIAPNGVSSEGREGRARRACLAGDWGERR